MRETWYKLENGAVADPADVSPGDDGRLVHSSGVAVAMKGGVPSSIGVDPEVERAKASPAPVDREIRPAPARTPTRKPGYKTRSKKAR